MTTLEFMEKELEKHKQNLERQQTRNAPKGDLENIVTKIKHYEVVCRLLRKEEENETIKR